MTVAMTFY